MTLGYRTENGRPVLDVRVSSIDHLFDNRDPAPFRERDLDPDVADYLVDGGQDLRREPGIHIVFWLSRPCNDDEIRNAVHAHFDYQLERARRRRREQVRTGWIMVTIAAVAIVVLVSLGELVSNRWTGALGAALREALLISGWVLMWRPVEVLIYDAIPWRRERRVLRALRDASIDVRTGEGAGEPVREAVRAE
jgi:hypothetical protein